MARKRRAATKPPSDEEVIEDLEDLEDLEALADATEDVEDVEDDEEEEETPRRKRKRTPKKSSDAIGSADLAEALGTTGRELRVLLRENKVAKNESGRYEWPSVDDALDELGYDSVEDAQEALAESRSARLDALKERVGADRKSKKKKRKAKVVAEDDEEEEEDEDEEEEEEETPAPKSRTRRRKKK